MNELKVGIIGTDTSHSVAFTRLLNDSLDVHHVQGGKVVEAFPGGSPDFPLSYSRVNRFMEQLQTEYNVVKMDSIEEIALNSDAILLESADGRVHLEQFRRIAAYGKPVFIDKPLALTVEQARKIYEIAEEHKVPLMSSSALRYAEALTENLQQLKTTPIKSVEVNGPLVVEPTQLRYFWYAIHMAEMLYTIMGPGCTKVKVIYDDNQEMIKGQWQDGRTGTIHCDLTGTSSFGAKIQTETGTSIVHIESTDKPFYASLLEQVMSFFRTGISPVDKTVTLEIIRFLEAAEQSRASGEEIGLI